MLNQKIVGQGRWIASTTVILASMLCASQAQAGTAAYFAKCSFLDRGNNNGGSVFGMSCYAVEGGNAHGAFFHIVRKDGRKKPRHNRGLWEKSKLLGEKLEKLS